MKNWTFYIQHVLEQKGDDRKEEFELKDIMSFSTNFQKQESREMYWDSEKKWWFDLESERVY